MSKHAELQDVFELVIATLARLFEKGINGAFENLGKGNGIFEKEFQKTFERTFRGNDARAPSERCMEGCSRAQGLFVIK